MAVVVEGYEIQLTRVCLTACERLNTQTAQLLLQATKFKKRADLSCTALPKRNKKENEIVGTKMRTQQAVILWDCTEIRYF